MALCCHPGAAAGVWGKVWHHLGQGEDVSKNYLATRLLAVGRYVHPITSLFGVSQADKVFGFGVRKRWQPYFQRSFSRSISNSTEMVRQSSSEPPAAPSRFTVLLLHL